jgi:hypothetical protein
MLNFISVMMKQDGLRTSILQCATQKQKIVKIKKPLKNSRKKNHNKKHKERGRRLSTEISKESKFSRGRENFNTNSEDQCSPMELINDDK